MQTTNITVVIIVFSTSHACDIAQSRDSNTVQRYGPRSIACLSTFLLCLFVGVGALAGRTQFLFSRPDLLQDVATTFTLYIIDTVMSLSSDELSNSESESDDS